jgi:hypothetical protein
VINWRSYGASAAVEDFKAARRRAALEEINSPHGQISWCYLTT